MNPAIFYFLAILLIVLPTEFTSGQKLTSQQNAGKLIYERGIGSSKDKITATMSGINVPATVMTCSNCHGQNGKGNPEGGITPSNIQWSTLTKGYGALRLDGSFRKQYNASSLRKVITSSVDPSGNKLHSAMPRFNMPREDLDNLIEYLKIIEFPQEVGITDSTINIGLILTGTNYSNSNQNNAILQTSRSFISYTNANGGFYGRKLVLNLLSKKDRDKISEQFALLCVDNDSLSIVDGPPLISLYSPKKNISAFKNPNEFSILPGITDLSISLIEFYFSLKLSLTPNCLVLYDKEHEHLISSIVQNTNTLIKVKAFPIDNSQEILARIEPSSAILMLTNQQNIESTLESLALLNHYPIIMLPGQLFSISEKNITKGFDSRIYLGYPNWPSTRTATGLDFHNYLVTNHGLSTISKNLQMDFLANWLIVEEVLKRCGHDLNHSIFVSELEKLFDFPTGLTLNLTFDINKHIASDQVFIIKRVDSKKGFQMHSLISSKSAQ